MLPVLASWPRFEKLRLGYFLIALVGNSAHPAPSGQYPQNRSTEITIAVVEAWTWLEGAALLIPHPHDPHEIRLLSRKAQQPASEPTARRISIVGRLTKETLHPKIREDVWALYHRSKFDTAVFEAMKAVEVAVRDAAGYTNADFGTDMIARAFHEDKGPLRDPAAQQAERIARRSLFVGAHGSYKNPHSHRNVALDDPDEAAEIIMLAGHLLRIVDSRKAAGRTI